MADQAALAIELADDPLGRGYALMTDAEVVASLAAVDRRGVITMDAVVEYLLLQGRWPSIVDAAHHGTAATARQVAWGIILTAQRYTTINAADPTRYAAIDAQLGALVAAGFIAEADKIALLAMGENKQSRAEELGIGRVLPGDVAAARA